MKRGEVIFWACFLTCRLDRGRGRFWGRAGVALGGGVGAARAVAASMVTSSIVGTSEGIADFFDGGCAMIVKMMTWAATEAATKSAPRADPESLIGDDMIVMYQYA